MDGFAVSGFQTKKRLLQLAIDSNRNFHFYDTHDAVSVFSYVEFEPEKYLEEMCMCFHCMPPLALYRLVVDSNDGTICDEVEGSSSNVKTREDQLYKLSFASRL